MFTSTTSKFFPDPRSPTPRPVTKNTFNTIKLNNFFIRQPGFTVSAEKTVSNWADRIYENARSDYNWLIKRDKKYLTWRYEKNPDYDYVFYIVKQKSKAIGWWVIRHSDKKVFLVDALFCRKHTGYSVNLALQKILENYPHAESVFGWFSDEPKWWNRLLVNTGFEKKRQFQDLYFGVKSYNEHVNFQNFVRNFYFSMGDSDLF